MILNVNEPKHIPSINLDAFYVILNKLIKSFFIIGSNKLQRAK
jgi:hypothetical protein